MNDDFVPKAAVRYEELRKQVVSLPRTDVRRSGRCHLCKAGYWDHGDPEFHSPECPARPL
jgi:hypothetical protein